MDSKIEPDQKSDLIKDFTADCFQVRSVSEERFVKIGGVSVTILVLNNLNYNYRYRKNSIMNTSTIRQKLYEYIRVADDKKIKAICTMIESDVNESYEWWNDKDLVAELDSRSSDLKNGKDNASSWDEVKKGISKRS